MRSTFLRIPLLAVFGVTIASVYDVLYHSSLANLPAPVRLVSGTAVPPPIGSPTHTRKKDRLSYTHQEFAIDLTQVTATSGPNTKVRSLTTSFLYHANSHCVWLIPCQVEILHELEVELRHSDYLLMTASKRGLPEYSVAEQNAFDELIHAFVNNARILCRNAEATTSGR